MVEVGTLATVNTTREPLRIAFPDVLVGRSWRTSHSAVWARPLQRPNRTHQATKVAVR